MLIVGVSVGVCHDPGCCGVMEVEKGEGLGLWHHGNQGQGQGQGQGQEGPTANKGKDKGNKGMGNDRGKKDKVMGRGMLALTCSSFPQEVQVQIQGQVQR